MISISCSYYNNLNGLIDKLDYRSILSIVQLSIVPFIILFRTVIMLKQKIIFAHKLIFLVGSVLGRNMCVDNSIHFSGQISIISRNYRKASAINLVYKKFLSFISKATMALPMASCSSVRGLECWNIARYHKMDKCISFYLHFSLQLVQGGHSADTFNNV